MSEEKPFLTVKEIADMLDFAPRTIQQLIQSGALPAHRIGKEYRVARADFAIFMERTRTTEEKRELEKMPA